MHRPGWGRPEQAPNLDPGLRETAVNSVTRWKRRLEARQRVSSEQMRSELALTGREAGQLRSLATTHGAVVLARLLEGVESVSGGPASAMAEAVERVSEHIGPGEPARAVAQVPAGGPGQALAVNAVAPHPGRSIVGPSIVSPDILGPGIASGPLAEPPLLDASPAHAPRAFRAPTPETLLSAQGPVAAAPLPGPVPRPSPPEPIAAARGSAPDAVSAVRLLDSIRALKPPKLLGTLMGFRAFGRGAAGRPDAGPIRDRGILGLRASPRPEAVARYTPSPPPHDGPRGDPWRRVSGLPAGSKPTSRRPSRPPPRAHGSVAPWWVWFFAIALGVFAVTITLVIVFSGRPSKDATDTRQPTAPAEPSSVGPVVVAPSASRAGVPLPDSLTTLIHQHGRETPELRLLLDTQSRLALTCKSDPATCGRGWTPLSRDAFNPVDRTSVTLAPDRDIPLAAWLQRLKLPPDFPIHDDPTLRAIFDFNTKNIAGRQRFQAKLFECAAYGDIFDSTLVKYGAPSWLSAVVYQESGCDPRATSDVGAKGLWQFMPESARAYGLRVVDGEIDERLNPIKSTDGAIHFLTDLQRKLGAWDLVLAAYNMGPFAVLARLAQAGESASFWDLAQAGLLPDETAGYVPAIEAYALALQNLGRLQFSRDGKRLESTAEIVVKPGLRLSLIARAASTTAIHIRELNPEFLRDVVPEGETTVRVPDAEAHRAQVFVDSWSPDDNRDTCVPEDFDWGGRPFDTSKYAKSCPQSAATP
jgi:hypothetical protein